MLGSILEGREERLLGVGIVGGASMGVVMLVMRCVPDGRCPGPLDHDTLRLEPSQGSTLGSSGHGDWGRGAWGTLRGPRRGDRGMASGDALTRNG